MIVSDIPLLAATAAQAPTFWEASKTTAEAVSAVLAIPGTVIAAAWVFFRFRKTESNAAKLEYEKAKKEYEQLLSPSYLNGEIEHRVVEENDHWVIMGVARGENTGKINLQLDFHSTKPVVVSKLEPDDSGAFVVSGEPMRMEIPGTQTYHSANVASGGTFMLDFAFKVKEQGYYLIEFMSRKTLPKPEDGVDYDYDDWMLTKVIRVPSPPPTKKPDEKKHAG